MKTPSLKTDRLLLRGLKSEDVPRIQLLASDRKVSDTLLSILHPFEIEMAEQYVANKLSLVKNGEGICFAIILLAEDILVGLIMLKKIDQTHRSAEMGYWIGKEYWKKGYATEAAVAVINHGFGELSLQRIYAHCLGRNSSSGKVLSKLGMTHEGRLRQHILKGNEFEDVEIYGILRSEHCLGEGNPEALRKK